MYKSRVDQYATSSASVLINGTIGSALIAVPRYGSEADVNAGVNYARENYLPSLFELVAISIRGDHPWQFRFYLISSIFILQE